MFGGVRRYTGDVDVRIGDPATPKFDFDGGEYVLNFQYDQIDDRYFPSEGGTVNASYINSDDSLGADENFDQVELSALHTWTRSRHNFTIGARYDSTLDNDAPIYAQFRAGGFTRLSGFRENELFGQHFGELFSAYRYKVARATFYPMYAGATIEYGNVVDRRSDLWDDSILNGSLYFGFRSPLGPIYAGFGFAEGGRDTYFVRIGNPFGAAGFGR